MAEVIDIYTKKRVRSSNWDEEEKRLLRQLVLERIDVIENKDTSTNTNMKKKSAWQEVLSCFNSLNNKKRDLKELTTQWRNTKGKVESRDSEYKRAKLMTGGGPPPPSPPPEDIAIIHFFYTTKLANKHTARLMIYSEDYEQELFLLAKKTKEREYERAEEIHKKKIAILDMEYEYWKKKLNNSID